MVGLNCVLGGWREYRLIQGFGGEMECLNGKQRSFRRKTKMVRLWGIRKMKGKGGKECCDLPFLHKHVAKLIFGPPNAEGCSRANTGSFWG